MSGPGLLDMPPEIFRAIVKQAVLGQCFDPISATEDVEASSDGEALPANGLIPSNQSSTDSQSESEGPKVSTADVRVVLQWRKVNHTFDHEVMLCIEDVELLRPGTWHDINICPGCNCQAPIDSLSSFAASFLLRQPSSGKIWESNMPALLNHIADEVTSQEGQQSQQITPRQRHHHLKVFYQEFLEHMFRESIYQDTLTGHGHELLPGIHPNDPLEVPDASCPKKRVLTAGIFLGQVSPVSSFIQQNKGCVRLNYSYPYSGFLESLLYAAVKTGQYNLTRELLNMGDGFCMQDYAFQAALERQDLLMIQLLLRSKPQRYCLLGVPPSLIIRSTELDLRDITNAMFDHVEDLYPDLALQVLRNACYNGDEDLVRRIFTFHPGLEINGALRSLRWRPGLRARFPSPVEAAANRGHESILRLLLEEGAKSFRPSPYDDEACMIAKSMEAAANGGHVGIARILLEAGTLLSPRQWVGVVQSYAEARGAGGQNFEFIQFVLEEKLIDFSTLVDQDSYYLYKMVYHLCIAGDVAAIRLFASYGTPMHGSLYDIRPSRLSPMQIAYQADDQELIQVLVELGAPLSEWCKTTRSIEPLPRTVSPREVSFHCSQSPCAVHRLEDQLEY
ncbi:hypothetical protein PG993_011499 [Apiospora rasikravindrae]|uniref:Ankyrin n=1 Tax=Apiospora rasikravindrae TaxID=990691 RepID=A0ABR1SG19_9PEZI